MVMWMTGGAALGRPPGPPPEGAPGPVPPAVPPPPVEPVDPPPEVFGDPLASGPPPMPGTAAWNRASATLYPLGTLVSDSAAADAAWPSLIVAAVASAWASRLRLFASQSAAIAS